MASLDTWSESECIVLYVSFIFQNGYQKWIDPAAEKSWDVCLWWMLYVWKPLLKRLTMSVKKPLFTTVCGDEKLELPFKKHPLCKLTQHELLVIPGYLRLHKPKPLSVIYMQSPFQNNFMFTLNFLPKRICTVREYLRKRCTSGAVILAHFSTISIPPQRPVE